MPESGERALVTRVAAVCRTAVVTGPAAALVHGLPTLDRVRSVDLVLPGSTRAPSARTWPEHVTYRNGLLRPDDITTVDGIRVTSTLRCAFDTSRYYSPCPRLLSSTLPASAAPT